MISLNNAPLLNKLSRVELARLLPNLQEVRLSPGQHVRIQEHSAPVCLLIVLEGTVEVVLERRGHTVVVATIYESGVAGEDQLANLTADYQVRSVTDSTLLRIPIDTLRGLLRQSPLIAAELLERLGQRLHVLQDELVRARIGLITYSQGLWDEVDTEVACTIAPIEPTSHHFTSPPPAGNDRQSAIGRYCRIGAVVLSLFASGITYALLHSVGWMTPTAITGAVLVAAVINWMIDTMPDYVIALGALVVIALLRTSPSALVLSGFSNTTWFLSLAVVGIGAAITRSGLLFRVALHMLRLLPPTYMGQTFALALAGLILTPILPSPNGRVAVASPLAVDLSDAMRLPRRSRGSAGLGMAVLLGFGQMYFWFLNGTGSCILLWSLLPSEIKARVTWGYWFLMATPLGIVVFLGGFLALSVLFRPQEQIIVTRNAIREQIKILGPLGRNERITLVVTSLVLVAFITQPIHGVDPAWLAFGGLLALIGAGVVDTDTFRRGIDWNFLMLYGGLISLAAVMEQTGISAHLGQVMGIIFRPLLPHPWLFLVAIAVVTVLVRVALPMVAAALLMAVTLYPLAQQAGINPFVITLVVQVACNPWFLAHQNTFYQTAMAGTDGNSFTHRQVKTFSYAYAALTILAVCVAVPIWHRFGLVP